MNTNLVLMLGALILLAISGLLVFCFTESKGKNTPHARKFDKKFDNAEKSTPSTNSKKATNNHSTISLENKLV